MKLRNKWTGEIMDDVQYRNYSLSDGFGFRMNGKEWEYHSLAELNADWEDYEEPKEYWCINSHGEVISCIKGISEDSRQPIGNYFNTREEAKKAVEKLKAWKRLENARFEFGTIKYNLDEESSSTIAYDGIITIKGMAYEDFVEDLNTCFGGEE